MEINDVPEGFPRDKMPAVVSGMQPKLGVVLHGGCYVVGQTDEERYERWLICEDLVNQLAPVARKDAASHPQHSPDQTLERARVAVERKGWISPDEQAWLAQRLRTVLRW
ncbi:hypothetical protein [Paraburkholderia caffeinilytica]|uniref:hypothetical protein n=1 Tax=Paraburkholderia caffeinilytica TaxID=1761016 RepID=UPI003DA1814F